MGYSREPGFTRGESTVTPSVGLGLWITARRGCRGLRGTASPVIGCPEMLLISNDSMYIS